ncbi:hypothetical protein [[Clostridium] scindens]|nr:hypothetical protein [[Clostridium] scindens]
MNENDYLKIIKSMIDELDESDESDIRFLRQLYTIIHRHLLRKRRD